LLTKAKNAADAKAGKALSSIPARRAFMPMPVVALLGLLIAAAMLPPLALSGFLLQRTNSAQEEVVATLAEATAGAAIETVDRQLQGMVSTLRGLSTANSLSSGSLEDFYDGARSALAGTDIYLIVLDKDMNQLLNTRVPFGQFLPKTADPLSAQLALESGAVVISDGFLGKTSQKWVFNTILPWTQPGKDPVLLILSQNAESLTDALAMENLRGGWNAVILDRKGMVLSSTLMSSDVGKPFFLGQLIPGGSIRSIVDYEGHGYDVITKQSDFSHWRVALWARHETIQRPMLRTLRLLLLGAGAMIAVGGFATWFLGRQITKSVRKLADDAHRLGAGVAVSASTYPVSEFSSVSAALADASAQRRASENEIRFLMREVAHRSKNQLTVVSSLAKQSARGATNVAEFSESFQQRLMGLARSTDLLIAGSVAGVELGELLKVQIEPFGPGDLTRLRFDGPAFKLSLQAAQTLGLAIHEMATNAAKYGAFSTPRGKLDVKWSIVGDDVVLVWRERLPSFEPTEQKTGFGTQLIDRTLGGALGARIERIYHPNGLECRIEIPADKLVPDAKSARET